MDERGSREAKIERLSDGTVSIKTSLYEDPETGELFRFLKCGKHQIIINQTKLIKLAEVPDMDFLIILSLKEAQDLLKYQRLNFDFAGRILFVSAPEKKHGSIVVLNLEYLIEKGVEETRISVVDTLGHEMRHAQQYQQGLLSKKGFCDFMKRCGDVFHKIERRNRFSGLLLKALPYLLASMLGFFYVILPSFLASIAFTSIAVIAFLILVTVFYFWIYDAFWSLSERDARKFAKKITKDKNWLDCVTVIKNKKSSP